MNKIIEKYKQDSDKWNSFISISLSALGIIISIITMFVNPNNGIISTAVVVCELIVLITSLVTFTIIEKTKKTLAEGKGAILEQQQAFNMQSLENAEKLKQHAKMIEKLALFSKNINKRINNFLTLLCDENDKYFYNLSCVPGIPYNEIEADDTLRTRYQPHIINAQKQYKECMYVLYNRYIKGVLEELINIISIYLQTNNKYRRVTIAIKLFDTTYSSAVDPKEIKVYTAFRDKETYDENKREIGGRHYSISENSDFQICMKRESYFRNNISITAEDYANENFPGSLQHYNCTAVVPIICDYKSDRNIYGYLCCETLNNDSSVEIFDKRITDILYTAALAMGMFFDTANAGWDYIIDDESDFLTFLHNKCYRGK